MNKVCFCWLALAFYWCEGFGQTNCPVPMGWLSVPHVEMKRFECEPSAAVQTRRIEASGPAMSRQVLAAPAVSANVSTNNMSPELGEMALNSSDHADLFQTMDVYRRLDEGGYLTKPYRPDGLLAREMDSMYRPEVFHVGKTTIRCSLVSAIKHKDPLCLFNLDDPESNPSVVFFKWSW
jgi:hypothetical protein